MSEEQDSKSQNVPCIAFASFSPDAKILITASLEGVLAEWDTSTGQRVRVLLDPDGIDDAPAPSVVSIVDGQEVDADFRLERLSECMRGSSLLSLCFSPDGKYFAVGAANGAVVVWNTESRGELLGSLLYDMTHALQYSPDGKLIATGDDFGTVSTWDVETRTRIHKMRAHRRFVTSVHFSPDGRRLASGSRDGGVKIWDVGTGDQLEEYSFGGSVLAFRYSVDGRVLYGAETAEGSDPPNIHRLA